MSNKAVGTLILPDSQYHLDARRVDILARFTHHNLIDSQSRRAARISSVPIKLLGTKLNAIRKFVVSGERVENGVLDRFSHSLA